MMKLLKKMMVGLTSAAMLAGAFAGAAVAEEVQENSDTYNMLLIGVDRRDESWYGNSDVMILVTVNPDKESIYLTSFMRDLYADIPGIGVQKLNAACANGGPELCVETIKENYQVQIDNYAMVDFNTMAEIVDTIDGVEVELTEAEAEYINNFGVSDNILSGEGLMWLDGAQAVAHSRNRSTGATSDFGRTERQRQILTAIFEKAKTDYEDSKSSGTLQKLLSYMSHDLTGGDTLKLMTKISTWLTYEMKELRVPFDDMYYIQNEILTPTDMAATREKLQEELYR